MKPKPRKVSSATDDNPHPAHFRVFTHKTYMDPSLEYGAEQMCAFLCSSPPLRPRGLAIGVLAWLSATYISACGQSDPGPQLQAQVEPQPRPYRIRTVAAKRQLVVHHPAALETADLRDVDVLELALHQRSEPVTDPCAGLDFKRLRAAERLQTLRLSGCGQRLVTGLASLPITRLELVDLTLDAAGVDQVARLPQLRTLLLERVTTTAPVHGLRTLALQELQLVDIAADAPLAELPGYWPGTLQSLVLVGPWIGATSFEHVLEAKALEELELDAPTLTSFTLAKLGELPKLRRLRVVGPAFDDSTPFFLRDLPLRELSCRCPRLRDHGLTNLRHVADDLHTLTLAETGSSFQGLATLRSLPRLRTLRLRDIDLATPTFAALRSASALTTLELTGELVDPELAGIADLEALEVLRIDAPDLDDRAAPALAPLAKLRTLDVSGSDVTDASLAHIAALPSLRELVLTDTEVTGRGLEHLRATTTLEFLDLGGLDIMDEDLAVLSELPNLTALRLDHTLVTDRGVAILADFPALERLDLSHTVVSTASAPTLTRFPKLEALGLEGTRLQRQQD